MSRKIGRVAIVPLLFLLVAQAVAAESIWWSKNAAGTYDVRLYFFWTETCPHCSEARPDIDNLSRELPWLDLQSFNLTGNVQHGRDFVAMAKQVGQRAQSVPAFIFCGRMLTGYDNAAGMGQTLRQQLLECKQTLDSGRPPVVTSPAEDGLTRIPLFGEFDLSAWSLPAVTLTLGLLDSFNPCAFFVLLFLLSLLVNARSRVRMLVIGGVFVSVSGIVYFLFMAAWLNLFLLLGQLAWITLAAGLLAMVLGAVNIKDFFVSGRGPTLSMPDRVKPGLFQRMRHLVGAQSMTAMLVGTLVLAVIANAYELLCTAGFPMVFTRILTLQELPVVSYYTYLALYCLVYVVPLLVIVCVFAWTLGRRKLTEAEGRLLKLMAGLMMSGLGLLLVFQPEWLNHLGVTVGLLVGVCLLAYLLNRFVPHGSS